MVNLWNDQTNCCVCEQNYEFFTALLGHASAQAVGRRLVTVKTRVQSQATPSGICHRQSVNGTGFSQNTAVYAHSIIQSVLPYH